MKIFILKMPYSIPYILLICFFLLIATFQLGVQLDQKTRRYLNYIVILTYILFFGFRGFVGWDWYNYYPYFTNLPNFTNLPTISNFIPEKNRYEFGFSLFSVLIKSINPDYNFYILINCIVNITLLSIFLKRYVPSNLFAFSLVTFIVMEGFILEVNLLRNIKSVLLFLISLRYIENRKFFKFLILNLLGVLFHWSAIIYLPLYFFLHKKVDLRVYFFIFIIGNIIYLFQIQYVKPVVLFLASLMGKVAHGKAEGYLSSKIFGIQYGITFGYLERVTTSLLIMFYYNKLINRSKSNILFINSFFIFFVVYFFFSEISVLVNRVGILFFFSYWILWPQIIEVSERVTKYLLFFFMAIYLNVRIISMTNNILYKYDNIMFENCQSYQERLKVYEKHSKQLQKK